jgi:RNA polymerase sigma factor (sigma-70 family)
MTTPTLSLAGECLEGQLMELWEGTGDQALLRLGRGQGPEEGIEPSDGAERLDWVNTCLMNSYKNTGDPQVFSLLFKLNRDSFQQAIQCRLRRNHLGVDADDVLQEVFLNIYRYPHRFKAEKADSFRNWGHRIVRNTLLKFLKGAASLARGLSLDDDLIQRQDSRERSPERCAAEAESARIVDTAYLIYLNLYLTHFQRLSEKERRALTMVEVESASYKQAARALSIRLENLKMVIFRGRRKIYRGLQKTLDELFPPQFSPKSNRD